MLHVPGEDLSPSFVLLPIVRAVLHVSNSVEQRRKTFLNTENEPIGGNSASTTLEPNVIIIIK